MIKGFPEEIRASWLAKYWYCAEMSRIRALEPIHVEEIENSELPPVAAWSFWGTCLHDMLERRKHWSGNKPSQTESFKSTLRGHMPLSFKIERTRIFFHPDNYIVHYPRVQIIEYKSTYTYPTTYKLVCDRFQLQVYIIGLKRVLKNIFKDLKLAERHRLQYYKMLQRPTDKIKVLRTFYIYTRSEAVKETPRHIREIFKVWRRKRDPLPPHIRKCRRCIDYWRFRCRFYRQILPLKDWKERFEWEKPTRKSSETYERD